MIPAWFDPYVGPAAGVGASVLWSFTTLLFTAAGRRLGATLVNALRIVFALVWLGLTHRLLTGDWVPAASTRQVGYLALSGFVGLSVGDWALFASFVSIGPRLASLICTTSPIFAAVFGWLVLRESLSGVAWLGMVLTIAGVAWVVAERPGPGTPTVKSNRARGVFLALVAAACQAAGYLLSKQGIGHGWLPREEHMPPQTATFIRMFFAALFVIPVFVWLAARARGSIRGPLAPAELHARRLGYFFTFCGSLVGPFLGVWMSLVASDRAKLGVAQTLISLTPVFILPLVMWIHHERVSVRAALGALVAVAGTALLFLPESG